MSPAFVTLLMMALGVDKVGYASSFAAAIAQVASEDAPPSGYTAEEGAAMLTVSLYEEGRFCIGASCGRGDKGKSVCSGQVRAFSEAHARQLELSPLACARGAYAIIRGGAAICPDAPLAPYCGGCNAHPAREMAERRWRKAEWLFAN
jgi:hypothetical protein